MGFAATGIPGVVLVEPTIHRDERGFFLETYSEPRYRENGIPEHFVQDNHSRSSKHILRGLHAQSPNPQGKLVRCVEGAVWDVAVDVRLGSPSFGRWVFWPAIRRAGLCDDVRASVSGWATGDPAAGLGAVRAPDSAYRAVETAY